MSITFEEMYDKYKYFMRHLFNRFTRRIRNAYYEEYVNHVWVNWHKYSDEKSKAKNPKQFLYWMLRDYSRKVMRDNDKNWRVKQLSHLYEPRITKGEYEADTYDELIEALDKIKPRNLDMLALWCEGQSTHEVGLQHGVTSETVRRIIKRVIQLLRYLMHSEIEDEEFSLWEFNKCLSQ